VYITHDLTTAYQIAQNIYVLYRGSVAEVGSVDKVISEPKHPYTRLLVSSVPQPDPDIHWGGAGEAETRPAPPSAPPKEIRGCKFSNRCPFVMPECRQAAPPLYLTDDDRAVACYLHEGATQVSGREMAESLATA
jgi:peptide/nickel transport system ATP-binding protein